MLTVRRFGRIRHRFSRLAGLAGLAAVASVTAWTMPAIAEEKAIIVLDASGSMWGQIDGTPKITIAREVLDKVLYDAPRDLWLGFMAYGHREKGNCADIELFIAPAPSAAAEISGTARDLKPKGKTPLSDAVRRAAEALKYTEQKATVILITDGIETCHADPCALARELEASGVDFTTHVVGFGLSAEEGRQVACLADETGGLYIQAQDAASLTNALADTVAEAAAPAPEPQPEPVAVAEPPSAAIAAPDEVAIGALFDLTWEGPGDKFDEIYLFDPAAENGKGKRLHGRRLINSPGFDERTLRLAAPLQPGGYQLHYYYGRSRDIIATRPITIVAAEVSLAAPATVDIGATFVVEWIGPGGNRDAVLLFDPAAGPDGKVIGSARLSTHDFANRKVSLVAPVDAGFYELRYAGDDGTVLATRQIEILPAEVSISAPESVFMGDRFVVAWVGPGGRRDAIEVFDESAGPDGKAVASARLANGDYDGRTVTLVAPATPGPYVLRYYNGDSRAVLATRPLTIAEAEVGLTAPASVDMGTSFEIEWIGPGARRDAIEIFDEAAGPKGKVVASKRLANGDYANRKVTVTAPIAPGGYLLRYYNGDSRMVLATAPLTVVETEVSVSAPDSVAVGEAFVVEWIGPGAYRDAIQIVDTKTNKVVESKRLANDDYRNRKATLKAPKAAGAYRLRYYNGDGRAVLAERTLTVN